MNQNPDIRVLISRAGFRLLRYFLLFIACCLLLFVSSIEASGPPIQKIDVEGLYSIEKEELLYLLNVKAGDVLSPLTVRNGIKRVFLKGIFEDISVEVDDADKSKVKIKVKERDIVKGIYISGNEHLSKKVIKGHFLFTEGQVMRYDLIEDSIKKLRHALSERGFHRAEASIQVERTTEPYRVNVILRVNEGEPELIKSIKIYGPEYEVRSLMKVTEGDIYDQFRLRADLNRIKRHYKKLGYLNPSAGPYTFFEGELDLSINPGKKLGIFFEGNSDIDSKALLKEMPFFDAEDFRDDLVEEASARITALYHSRGYSFAQVAPVVATDKDTINLHFFVFEGERFTVGSIRFTGVTLPEKNLKEIMSLKEGGVYNSDLIDSDRESLREFYNALGYLNAHVEEFHVEIRNSKADINVTVSEGAKTEIISIEIKGAELIPEEKIRSAIGIKPGNPYNEVDISDARYRVIELYGNYGFTEPMVDVKREFVDKGARIVFDIGEGPITFFGKTVIRGNSNTRREVISRELIHRESRPFNYSLLTKERQRLYKLGLFTDVDIDALHKENDARDILIGVKEGKAGIIEFGFGYGEYERYRGFFDISYRNLFGMNRQASFRIEVSSLEQRYILSYFEPWFLGRPMPFRMLLMREERTEKSIDTGETRYKLRRHTASAGFEKRLSEKLKADIFYEFSIVKTFDVKPDVILTRDDMGTLAISAIRPGIIYDTRDNPFDPRRGVLAGISLKMSSSVLLSETDFMKVIFHGSIYKEVSRRFVLALSLRGGIAQGFGATRELPLVERFFLGGRTTVRGYEQDTLGPKGVDGTPTGGNAFLSTNLELRTSIGKGAGLVTFVDGGNVWRKMGDVDASGLKYTAGMGIRYNTPVGPLRIDYGHKLQRERGESRGEVHFSIGHAF